MAELLDVPRSQRPGVAGNAYGLAGYGRSLRDAAPGPGRL